MRRPTRGPAITRNQPALDRLNAGALNAMLRQPGLSVAERTRIKDALANIRETRPTIPGLFIPSGVIPGRPGIGARAGFTGVEVKPALVASLFREFVKLPDTIEGGRLHFVTDSVLDRLRSTVPGALPEKPLPSGERGANLPLSSAALTQLLRLAAVELCEGNQTVIWDDGINELTVHAGRIGGTPISGAIRVDIPVACDQARTVMQIPFAVGGPERKAGMIMATTDRPAGDATIATIWGEALIALAYGALLEVMGSYAGASGRDEKNKRLIPRAITAQRGGLLVETQARFQFRALDGGPGR